MIELNSKQILHLKKVIEKFPEIKDIAEKFNKTGIKWAIAAGTAVFVYCGGDESLIDDIDIWIASKSKEKVAEIIGAEWQPQFSERHRAENIRLGDFDIFINCQKYQDEVLLMDYLWTDLVEEYLREVEVDGVTYKILAPEDVILLKAPNPREKDKEDIKRVKNTGVDNDYLQKRKIECKYKEYGN